VKVKQPLWVRALPGALFLGAAGRLLSVASVVGALALYVAMGANMGAPASISCGR
jgi:hypothetical protein